MEAAPTEPLPPLPPPLPMDCASSAEKTSGWEAAREEAWAR